MRECILNALLKDGRFAADSAVGCLTLVRSHSIPLSRSYSLTLLLSHSRTLSRSHSLTLSLSHSRTLSYSLLFSHSLTLLLSRSLTPSLPHPLTLPPSNSLTLSLAHLFTLSLSQAEEILRWGVISGVTGDDTLAITCYERSAEILAQVRPRERDKESPLTA